MSAGHALWNFKSDFVWIGNLTENRKQKTNRKAMQECNFRWEGKRVLFSDDGGDGGEGDGDITPAGLDSVHVLLQHEKKLLRKREFVTRRRSQSRTFTLI